MLQEIDQRVLPIHRRDDAFVSWENPELVVNVGQEIYFLDFSYNILSFEKKFHFSQSTLPASIGNPSEFLIARFPLHQEMKNSDIVQMIVDPLLWPHNPQLLQEQIRVVSHEWAPENLLPNSLHCIAVLNNIGGVEIFVKRDKDFERILDFSELLKCFYKKINKEAEAAIQLYEIQSLEQLKKAVYSVSCCSICWSPLNEDGTVYFVTSQKCGSLIFCKLYRDGAALNAQIVGSYQADHDMMHLWWIPKTNGKFWLVCSSALGELLCYDCEINNNTLIVVRAVSLWKYDDKMIAKHLKCIMVQNKIVIFFSKFRHLVVQLLDFDGNLISQYFKNINESTIMNIVTNKNKIYLATSNCKIFEVHFQVLNECLDIKVNSLDTRNTYSNYDLYGFDISANGIFVMALQYVKISARKLSGKRLDLIFLRPEGFDETTYLFESPSQKLTQVWDCLELIRLKANKLKTLSDKNNERIVQRQYL